MAPSSEPSASGRMRRKTLINMRWLAITGQCAGLLVAHFVFTLPINLLAPFLIIGASALFNIVASVRAKGKPYLRNAGATFALGFDVLQLSALLFVCGGFTNPFSALVFTPLIIATTVLSGRSVIALALFSLTGFALLFFSTPLDWPAPQAFSVLFVHGMATAVLISSAFLALYVRRVAREARRLSEALSSSHLALAHERKISAFGALAAAVAHELGSPLSTIAVVAKELAHDLKDSPHREDMDLLQSQIARCRTILTDFSKHNVLSDRAFESMPLRAFLETVLTPYQRKGLAVETFVHSKGDEPHWPLQPGLMHGVGNILQNACHFARSYVSIVIYWEGSKVSLHVLDDGPGFPPELLPKVGQAYVSGRDAESATAHMGLGLFIAKTLLQRSGANVSFANRTLPDGSIAGAEVIMNWEFLPT